MMKKILLIVAILFTNIFTAQQNNIYVEYSVKIYDEEIMKNIDSDFRRMFVKAMENAENISFGLPITKSGSKFYENPRMAKSVNENFSVGLTVFTGHTGEVFQYLNNLYKYSPTLGKDVMVKEDLVNNWELHNETKLIDNYLCYKATNVNRVDNGSGRIFNHPVIAWYCPQLPYSYGPNGYSNLPGLILQLQVRNVVFAIKKMDLNSDLDFDASFLKTVKTISLQQLNKKIEDEMELLGKSLGQ